MMVVAYHPMDTVGVASDCASPFTAVHLVSLASLGRSATAEGCRLVADTPSAASAVQDARRGQILSCFHAALEEG
jgi:hypothetical protein